MVWLCEPMPTPANTWRRCYWTVHGLVNSPAPISEFDGSSQVGRAIRASWR